MYNCYYTEHHKWSKKNSKNAENCKQNDFLVWLVEKS